MGTAIADVAGDKIGGHLMRNANAGAITTAERRFDRAERMVSNSSRANRQQAFAAAGNNLSNQQAKASFSSVVMENAMQAATNNLQAALAPRQPAPLMERLNRVSVDNTRPQHP